MRLYEIKAKYMSRLALLETSSKREKELKNMLLTKLNYLRSMNLPRLVHDLYLIIEHENVSEDFKRICREMLEDITKLTLEGD